MLPAWPASRPGDEQNLTAPDDCHASTEPARTQNLRLCAATAEGKPLQVADQNGGNARVAQVEDRSHSVRSSRVSRGWLSRIAIGELAVASGIWRALCGNCGMPVAARCARTSVQRGSLACWAGALAGVQDVSYPSGHAW